jgi:hypothetical protein
VLWSQLIHLCLIVKLLLHAALHLRELLHLENIWLLHVRLFFLFLCRGSLLLPQALAVKFHVVLRLYALVGQLATVATQWIEYVLDSITLVIHLFLRNIHF